MRKKLRNTFFAILVGIFICSFLTGFTQYNGENDSYVYLGGDPIGIIANSNGLVVNEFVNVTTTSGCYSPALQSGIQKGDVILAVNGVKITDVKMLSDAVMQSSDSIIVTVLRGGDKIAITIYPVLDLAHNERKIGITIKNNIAGIGTITFVTHDGAYGALGHQIIDSYGNGNVYQSGKIFPCDINGYNKPQSKKPGELVGKVYADEEIGNIKKNIFCGIFGKIYNPDFYDNNEKIALGNKKDVTPGKAYIMTTINANGKKKYEIEIVKTNLQNNPSEKGMVIRIVDKDLLSTTTGILQGMSGSPIIQNDKLIGAVTHVFTNDATMGYGIYIDWMLEQA